MFLQYKESQLGSTWWGIDLQVLVIDGWTARDPVSIQN